MPAVGNTIWYAQHTALTPAPSSSTAIPKTVISGVSDKVVTLIDVTTAPLYVTLGGTPASATVYDFKLPAAASAGGERHKFYVDPAMINVFSTGGSANYKVAYEARAIASYLRYVAGNQAAASAPTSSTALSLSAIAGYFEVVKTVIQVITGTLYVSLDGRTVSSTDYDYALTAQSDEARSSATELFVDPEDIRIIRVGACTYKFGFELMRQTDPWESTQTYASEGFI